MFVFKSRRQPTALMTRSLFEKFVSRWLSHVQECLETPYFINIEYMSCTLVHLYSTKNLKPYEQLIQT